MLKKLFIVIAASALTFSVSAQNARIDAMGGCDIVDDITRVLVFPSYVNDFGDQIQVTGSPGGFGPAIGIKSIGRNFNVGAMANMPNGVNSSVLRSDFYSDAESAIENGPFLGADALPSSFPTYPHFLLGVDLNAVTLGLDLFIEATRYKGMMEIGNDKIETSASISNFGTRLSANLELGNFVISPLFGIGFPKAKTDIESSGTNVTDTTITLESEKKLFFNVGAELGLEVRDFNIIGGFFYTLESYQFDDRGTKSDEYKGTFIDAYLGLIADVRNGLLFVTQYNLSVGIDKAINSDDDINKLTDLFHDFRFGFERPVSGVWIFDDVIPRAGIRYTIADTSRTKIENEDSDTITTENFANYSTQVQLTAGLGVTKGIATIDLAVRIGSWDGVLTGPNVISGTLTLDFGKRSGSSGSRRESRPSPSPVYETEESDYQTEPETESEETESTESGSDVDFDF